MNQLPEINSAIQVFYVGRTKCAVTGVGWHFHEVDPPSGGEISNDLCSGTAAQQATCGAQWLVNGTCNPPGISCGTGVGTASDCSCDETDHSGVGADCFCNAT